MSARLQRRSVETALHWAGLARRWRFDERPENLSHEQLTQRLAEEIERLSNIVTELLDEREAVEA